jgi:hypothetical protein
MKYCFDLDGTLCTNSYPDYTKAQPILERIELVNLLYEQGHHITIETARGAVSGKDWKEVTALQLEEWGVKHHRLRVGIKMDADFYIDDKGINANEFFIRGSKSTMYHSRSSSKEPERDSSKTIDKI